MADIPETKREIQRKRDHERYMRNRERIIAYNHDYYHNFLKKGLRKPKAKLSEEERKARRKAQQRARYWRDRDRILAQQRIYREEHKEHLKQLRRERDFKRIYMNPKREKFTKTKAERQHEYYMNHREEILLKRKRNYERTKQQNTIAPGA
jgi:hypothetical protein